MDGHKETLATEHAKMAAFDYLKRGITDIDERFGDGYAKANPVLLAAFIQACSLEFSVLMKN